MRGFGAVQTCFAAEAQMDKLAAALEHRPDRAAAAERARSRATCCRPARRSPARCRSPRRSARPPRSSRRRRGAPARPAAPAGRRGQHDARRGRSARRGLRGRLQEHRLLGGIRRLLRRARASLADGAAEVHCAAAEVGQGVTERDPSGRAHGARHRRRSRSRRLTATVDSAGSASASRMTWMAAGAVRDACRAALEEQRAPPGERGGRRARSTAIRARRRSIPRTARSRASGRTSRSRRAR